MTARIENSAAAPAPILSTDSRTARYRARVEAHLPTLKDDAARRAFLLSELRKWKHRFEQFETDVYLGRYQGTATAFDFQITFSDLYLLLSRYPGERADAA